MRILTIESDPFEFFPYWTLPSGGERDEKGSLQIELVRLEIYKGVVDGLPAHIDGLIVTSDLQGKVIEADEEFLLGEKLPEFLALLLELELPMLRKANMGVVLCGDLYATLQKRGGLGDVKEVWRKFKRHFKWVAGVAGNHDDFGSIADFESFKAEEAIYFFQQDIRKIDKVQLGGISGIIGRTDKPNRVSAQDYLHKLRGLLAHQPDAILLHQSPNYPPQKLQGEEKIRQMLESSAENLIFCGHSHWRTPLVELENRTQILNVDSRVVILINSKIKIV